MDAHTTATCTASFFAGLGGHFIFDALLVLAGALGVRPFKGLWKHRCERHRTSGT